MILLTGGGWGSLAQTPCIWPISGRSRLVGQCQPAKHRAQEYSTCGFEHCVMPVALGCLLSELHRVWSIRDLVLPSSRDSLCVQPAFFLSRYSYACRKTLCCGKESTKWTSGAVIRLLFLMRKSYMCHDQCFNGPLLPRKKFYWRIEQSLWLRQPLFNESLKNTLSFQCIFKSQ